MGTGKFQNEPDSAQWLEKCTERRAAVRPERGAALIIVLAFIILCTVLVVAFLTSITSSGVNENAGASENNASQLAATAVQIVEGTITNATAAGTYPTVAWACQPGMIRTYGTPGGVNGSIIASGSALAYYKLYSAYNMVVTGSQDMNPNDIFAGDVPANWNADPALYTDLNAPINVPVPNVFAASATTATVFPIVDPRAADSDIAVQGFNYSTTMTGLGGAAYTVPGVVNTGTSGVYANDTTSRLPMPVAWMYVLKDGTITVPPPLPSTSGSSNQAVWRGSNGGIAVSGTNGPTPSNPIVGRIAFWTDDECAKVNVNTASEGTYWDTPISNSGSSSDVFTSGTTALGDYIFANIQPAEHEYQRYPGHPATTCLSAVFGNILSSVYQASGRAGLVQAVTNAIPRISDCAQGSEPANSLNSTMGGTQQVTGTTGVLITDSDRLYASLDEFQFQAPAPPISANRATQNMNAAGNVTPEENDLDTCRFFLTAHSKAPELNMFGLPRVSIWPLWDTSQHGTFTAFDSEILRCSTINSSGTNPHQMCFFRYNPTSPTLDFPTATLSGPAGPTVARNAQVYGYLQGLLNSNVPGFGTQFEAKYSAADTNQILTEIFDYIRSTNLSDNSNGATPYTAGPLAGAPANVCQTGEVIPIQINNSQGMGRIATISELALVLTKVDDRANTSLEESGSANLTKVIQVSGCPGVTMVTPTNQTLIEWALIPRLSSPMCGYVALANDLRIRFSNFNLSIGGQAVSGTSVSVSDLYDTGRISCERLDSVMGGNIGTESLVEAARAGLTGSPSDSLYPTGLVVVSGTAISGTPTGTTISISGSVTATIYSPAGRNLTPGPQVQQMLFDFPATTVPIPHLYTSGTSTNSWYGTFRAPPGVYVGGSVISKFSYPALATINKSQLPRISGSAYNTYIGGPVYSGEMGTDVIRSVSPTGPLSTGTTPIMGDLRLVAISPTISSTNTFQPTLMGSGVAPSPSTYCADALRIGTGLITVQGFSFGTLIAGLPASNYGSQYGPVVPPQASGDVPAAGPFPGTGDWDNGPGLMPDGPWANKPDEGMTVAPAASSGSLPYIGNSNTATQSGAPPATLFSPNRQISSPVMFGSLPVGTDQPWRTLLFRPATLPGYHGTYTHPGNASPGTSLPDHLLLDLFWMPVVEPYGISEPFATSGKINLNYPIAPFSYITRKTGLDAVLKSVMITALNPNGGAGSFSQSYKAPLVSGGSPNVSNPTVTTRYPIDPDETLNQLMTTSTSVYPVFTRGAHLVESPNFFVSASQICDLPLIPVGYTSGNLSSFWAANSMTGDNSLERPYSLIYPRVTTKSNIYTVHVIAQSLRQTPADLQNGLWTENVDQVTSEYRGAFTIEKHYDPNSSDLSNITSTGQAAWPASSDGNISSDPTVAIRGEKWRVLGVKQFGQ